MTAISTDGYDIQPVVVRSLFIRAGNKFKTNTPVSSSRAFKLTSYSFSPSKGELHDVVINANNTPGCYVIRVQGIDECENAVQYGLLCYQRSRELQDTDPPVGGIQFSSDQYYYGVTDESLFDQFNDTYPVSLRAHHVQYSRLGTDRQCPMRKLFLYTDFEPSPRRMYQR